MRCALCETTQYSVIAVEFQMVYSVPPSTVVVLEWCNGRATKYRYCAELMYSDVLLHGALHHSGMVQLLYLTS
jgi:hypothetical protein